MTQLMKPSTDRYFFQSRILTHVIFWVVYYVAYSFLWVKEGNYYESFGLEFVLMPIRISAAYLTIYYLIPRFLLKEQVIKFLFSYSAIPLIAGIVQRVFIYFFHEALFATTSGSPWQIGEVVRAMVLINTTVLFLSAVKMYYYWKEEHDKNSKTDQGLIEIRSDKRTHRINPSDIQYIEGLGNYVTYYLEGRKPLISYMSLKETEQNLPDQFARIHKSFIVNKDWIESYTADNVEIKGRILPIGKSIELEV